MGDTVKTAEWRNTAKLHQLRLNMAAPFQYGTVKKQQQLDSHAAVCFSAASQRLWR